MRPSGIGGQAVIEGVMMRNKNQYAVAIRKPDKEIVVEKREYISAAEKHKFLNLPIIRGVVAFIESMVVGMKILSFSAGFYEEEEAAKPTKVEKAVGKVFKEKAESILMAITIIFSIALAVGIFMILPYFLTELLREKITSNTTKAIVEGVIRLSIFIVYVVGISFVKDIKRVFMYHGAEHKAINCIENGEELTIKNVKKQSKQHKRCGTSFLLYVMIISILFFAFIRVDNPVLRVVARLLLVPVVSGVAYEFIRLAGKTDSKIIAILSKPGLWLQRLTTREPDEEMIEVAIQSVEAVFDWKSFLREERKIRTFSRNGRRGRTSSRGKREATLEDKKENSAESAVTRIDHIFETDSDIHPRKREPIDDIFEEEEEEDDEILKAVDQFFFSDETDKDKK